MDESSTARVVLSIVASARAYLPDASGSARTILLSALTIFDQVPAVLSVIGTTDIDDLIRGKGGETGVQIADAITLHRLYETPEVQKATQWATGVFTLAVTIAQVLDAELRLHTGGHYGHLRSTIRQDFERQSERAIGEGESRHCELCARQLDEAEPVFTWVRRESSDESPQPLTVLVCRWCDAALSGGA